MDKLLKVLAQQKDFVTARQLSQIIGVTERSVRNYVNKLNQAVEDQQNIIISSKSGYKLNQNTVTSNLNQQLISDDDQLLVNMAIILVQASDYIPLEDISQKLHYSPENIRLKVQKLFYRIKETNIQIKLDSKIFTGIKLSGTESAKRLLIEELVPLQVFRRDNLLDDLACFLAKITTLVELKQYSSVINQVMTYNHCAINYLTYVKLLVHLAIMMNCIREQHLIRTSSESNQELNSFLEFKLAADLAKQLNFRNQKPEITALAYYLLSLPIDLPENYQIGGPIPQIVTIHRALEQAENYFNLPLSSNVKYRDQITNHLSRAINPIKQHIPIFNPYFNELKHEYLFAYSIASYIYDALKKDLELKNIPESEIAYLSIHIQLILNNDELPGIKTLLVVNSKKVESKLIKNKVETFFDNLKVVEIVSTFNPNQVNNYDLILIAERERDHAANHKVIYISRNVSSKDIQKIQSYLQTIGTAGILNDLAYFHLTATDNLTAIKLLLEKSGNLSLLDSFLEREAMSTTDIGNLTALPHPFLKRGFHDPKMVVGINRTNILWGKQNVRLIILYLPANELEINKNFFRDVYIHTNKINTVQQLLKTHNKHEFIQIWNQERGY